MEFVLDTVRYIGSCHHMPGMTSPPRAEHASVNLHSTQLYEMKYIHITLRPLKVFPVKVFHASGSSRSKRIPLFKTEHSKAVTFLGSKSSGFCSAYRDNLLCFARLKAGKANTGQDRYGYQRISDEIVVVEEEARWVRKIFEWYLEGCRLMEIRARLIAANAPQKGSSIPRRIQWARSSIQAILIAAKEYAYGIKIQSRKGEKFEISVEPIIDIATYERFVEMRAKKRTYPANHLEYDYMIGGLVHCACGLQ
jgi:hypothetical protein